MLDSQCDQPGHDVAGGHPLRPLRGHEHPPLLDKVVHVIRGGAQGVGSVVMGHEVYLVQVEEVVVQGPGGVNHNLVHVATMPQSLVPLQIRHDCFALEQNG